MCQYCTNRWFRASHRGVLQTVIKMT
uniref:Uncharacterized protein n=2 Tax=Anguilla anguilla TaxID=7936 RepID=A0A0E9US07_ANGAN